MATSVTFVDSRVSDPASLTSGGFGNGDWYILSPDEDGVVEMRRILAGYTDLDAIHIVSHGSEGAILLGRTRLDAAGLASHAADLGAIGASLSKTGDLLLYGCDVARGDAGLAFVAELARLTGAAVAASSNATGAAVLGGDWRLEIASGSIEAIALDGGGFAALLASATVSIAASWTYRAEGFTGSVSFTFAVTRAGDTSTSEGVTWTVAGAGPNPATAGDFEGGVLPAGTLTFAPGETSKTITVVVQANLAAEPEEGFTVGLSNATAGLTIDKATASATIIDEVGTRFVVSIDPVALLSNSSTLKPIFSPDGLKVAFQGYADNLVPNDTNNDPDFFVKDLLTGAVVRVSTDSAGGQADGDAQNNNDPISFSPDSTKVVFGSLASNLVPGDTNGKYDIFVKDLITGATTRVSTDAAGAQANDHSHQPVFSPDGTKVVFWSAATNLVPGDTNGKQDIFIKDLTTGAVTRVSTDAAGVQSNGQSDQPVFSPDGTKVAFVSTATNLVPADSNGAVGDLFIKDLVTGAIAVASTNAGGAQASLAVTGPKFSPDGTKVLFSSTAANLVAGDTNASSDIFVKDLITGTVVRASTDAAGGQANGGSFDAVFSPDGTRVSFRSVATNLVADDTNVASDIFVKDLTTGAIQRVSTNALGVQGDKFSLESNFSPDGRRLIITSDATNLVAGDTNGFVDAFIADLNLVSVTATNATRSEGPSGTTLFSFTVSRTGVITQPLSVDWSVTGAGVHPADAADFGGVLPSGTVFLAGSEPSTVVTVSVAGDSTIELDETFNITLSNVSVSDFMLGAKTAAGVIQNDDKPVASIAADAASHVEGNAGATTFTFTVTLDRTGLFAETVDWAVGGAGANAANAADFGGALPAGKLTFGIGQTSKTISIDVVGDTAVEANEAFEVTLANPSSGLAIGTSTASATIENDDFASVSIAALSAAKAEEDSGTIPFTFMVTLSQAAPATLAVDWKVTGTGDHAADGADFVGGILPSGKATFAPGETAQTITLPVLGDTIVELDDFFLVTLSNPSPGLALGTASALGVAQNDDRAKISIAPLAASKAEGDGGTTAFTFAVSLDQPSFAEQVADWTVTGSGANPATAADFGGALPSGKVTFAVGETSKVVAILVSGDTTAEFNEDFVVALSNLTFGLLMNTASAAGTILNDDKSVVSVTSGPGSRAEGTGAATTLDWTVSLDRAGVTSQTVAWAVTGGGAHAADAADLVGGVLPTGTLTFAPGETTKTVAIDVVGDATVEPDEGIVLTLSAPSPGLDLGTASATGTILNDDKSVVSVAAGPGAKPEGTGAATTLDWTVSLDRAGVTSQTVAWAIAGGGGHAADAADLAGGVFPTGVLTFAPGETTKTVTVDVVGDATVEPDEGIVLTLAAPSSGLDLGAASATGTIVNDDKSVVSVIAGPGSRAEGTGASTTLDWTVSLDRAGVTSQTVAWAVAGGGAHAADAADLVGGALPTGTLTFAPGETTKTVAVDVVGDATVEPDEGIVLTLSAPSSGLDLGTATMAGTIANDDASVSLAATPVVQAEGHSGTTAFTFVATLTGDSSVAHSVSWSVAGSGPAPATLSDFRGTSLPSGTIVFDPGETSKTIGVPILGETTVESDESFTVTLSSPSAGLSVATGTATGTIVNDDAVASIEAVAPPTRAEGNAGTTVFAFVIARTGDLSVPHTVSWSVAGSGGNPAAASDFAGGVLPTATVTFVAGETSKSVSVLVTGDTAVESDESFIVALSNPSSGLTLGTASAIGTIQNDDAVPVIVTTHDDAYIVLEGQSLSMGSTVGVLANDQNATAATLLTGASHGTLQLAGAGGFGYTPTAAFTGIDSFTYHAVPGGSGADGKASLYVVPVNVGVSTTLDLLALGADEQIAATYVAFFGRAADALGFRFWVDQFNAGLPTQGAAKLFANIASSFGVSAEAKGLYPFLDNPSGATDSQISAFLDSVYDNLFNRASDALGLAYWTGQIKATLQAGEFVGSVLVNIMSGAQDTAAGKDITTLMGKVAVSLEYVREQETRHTVWAGASDIAAATNLLDAVASDAPSVLIGIKNAETLIANHA